LDAWTLIQTFGWPIGTLMFTVIMLYTDQVVSGYRYREVCRQRDKLLRLALGGQSKAWRATELASALVPGGSGEDDPDVT
jgi:hypothetical protein